MGDEDEEPPTWAGTQLCECNYGVYKNWFRVGLKVAAGAVVNYRMYIFKDDSFPVLNCTVPLQGSWPPDGISDHWSQ